MKIALELDRSDLLVQETTRCRLEYRNTGATVVEVPNPDVHPQWPRFRVRGTASGDTQFSPEELWKKRRIVHIPSGLSLSPSIQLHAGGRSVYEFSLLERLELPAVGDYEIVFD
jgi:hypothetical protein